MKNNNGDKFDIIIIDPPWSYRNTKTGKGGNSSANSKYETMSNYDIKHSIIPEHVRARLLSDNCILFFWTTNSMIRDAIDIMNCWQFDHKTTITWVKKNYGLGNWFRGKTEHCLFGVKGKVKALKINMPNVIISDKTLKHSEKPEDFYKMVRAAARQMVWQQDHIYHIRILELFARQNRAEYFEGIQGLHYIAMGKELTGNDIVTDIGNYMKYSNVAAQTS